MHTHICEQTNSLLTKTPKKGIEEIVLAVVPYVNHSRQRPSV